MAEQYGYKANIEVPTADGKGQVDVVLERNDECIAIEVSVSTGAEWELHNIQKCLAGGYTKIAVCSSNPKKLQKIRQKIQSTLAPAEQSRILLLSSEEIPTLFAGAEKNAETATTMKGYRVKVQYDQSGGADTGNIIKRIIGSSKK